MSEPEKNPDSDGTDQIVTVQIYVGIAFLVLAVPLFCLWEAGARQRSNSTRDSANVEDDKAMAITMAQNFVKDRLKSPSSASFPWGFDEYQATRSADGTWSVSGWVESVNSFNAKLRVRWSVAMKREGTNWKLFSINIQD